MSGPVALAEQVVDSLATLGQVPVFTLGADDQVKMLKLYTVIENLAAAQKIAVVDQIDHTDTPTTLGAASTTEVIRVATNAARPVAHRTVKDSRAFRAHPMTATALGDGWLNLSQARVIIAAVDKLPILLGQALLDKAEQHLLDLARVHDAVELVGFGKKLYEVVDPDGADEEIRKKLEEEERKAARATFLDLRHGTDGITQGEFKIPRLQGQMLQVLLDAFTNPANPDPIPFDGLTSSERRGKAFCRVLERVDPKTFPRTGGINATVVVTMTVDTLLGGLQAANLLGTDHDLSPTQARLLACKAGVIPAVLDGEGHVLDLGRTSRTYKWPQRIALAIEQRGTCVAEHCDRPTHWCDGHHQTLAWAHLGETNKDDGVLFCERHHTLAHDPKLRTERLPDGGIRFHRRT